MAAGKVKSETFILFFYLYSWFIHMKGLKMHEKVESKFKDPSFVLAGFWWTGKK